MFKCYKCGKSSEPGEPMKKVVLETRTKHYPFRRDANLTKRLKKVSSKNPFEKKNANVHDKGGNGFETVVEVALCSYC